MTISAATTASDWILLAGAGLATALATGLGVIPVAILGRRVAGQRPLLWGVAAGFMAVASVFGLILPGLDAGSAGEVGAGAVAGGIFLLAARAVLPKDGPPVLGISGLHARRSLLVFLVLLVHSLPEGFAIGTAYASDQAGVGLFVILAIAIQNIPEGTSIAIPMEEAGFRRRDQAAAAVITSLPQPVGALVAFAMVEVIEGLLPVSFGFAAGAMLALVATELLPPALAKDVRLRGVGGLLAGSIVMYGLSLLIAL